MRAGNARGRGAAPPGRAARGCERAPGEPKTKSALQRPRAVQRQLAGSHRAAQLGLAQVDAVERGGVDAYLEVDVEAGVLEADRDLGGLENHPVPSLGVAKVELDHGSIRWEPPAIDVAGHPDDQQVGIEFLGARLRK